MKNAGKSFFTPDQKWSGFLRFRVTFSKLIFAESFTQDDLRLIGGGTISGFTQVDDYTWDVNVSGIIKGSSVKLTMDATKVNDYSAVANQVQVLGENIIRFEDIASNNTGQAASGGSGVNSAHGTLAKTGKNVDIFTPIFLLIFALLLLMLNETEPCSIFSFDERR